MNNSEQVLQLLNEALKLLQDNDPYAAEYTLSQTPASAQSNIYYHYILMHIFSLTGRDEEAAAAIDRIAESPNLTEDVVPNTLSTAIQLGHFSKAAIQLCQRIMKNSTLEAAAARFLLEAGDYVSLLNSQEKFRSDKSLYCAIQAAVFSGEIELALNIKDRLSDSFRRQHDVAAMLLSIERWAAFNLPEPATPTRQKLAVVTPLGPGHETLLEECRQSLSGMKLPEGWELEHIVVDDSAGSLGRSAARNQGIRHACELGADWLFFLDADDLIAEQALVTVLPYLTHYDAVWGLIASFHNAQLPVNRVNQLPFIDDRLLLLSARPFNTLQMGLFVKADVASAILFDETMNCGEDFKFYFTLWQNNACIKIPQNFFYNRRGMHSTGPRSATGADWNVATDQLVKEQIQTLDQVTDIRGHKTALLSILKYKALYYLSKDFTDHAPARSYRYIFSTNTDISTFEYLGTDTVLLDNGTLPSRQDLDGTQTLLVDLRRTNQRFFDINVMIVLAQFNQIDVLTNTADDLKYFKCNTPGHQLTQSEDDPSTNAVLGRLQKQSAKSPRFIFIAGYSRSGSTMAYNMLSTTVENYQFFDKELPVYSVMHTEQRPSISKRPLDIFDIMRIFRSPLASETALLVCYRDPRAMLTSKHKGVSDDYFIGYDKTYFLNPGGEASYTNPGLIDTHSAICAAILESRLHSIVPLRYEDLVLHTQQCQDFYGQVFQFKYSGVFADFYTQELGAGLTTPLNIVRAVDTSTIDKWQDPNHANRLRTQFARCPALYELMKFYGYGNGYKPQ